MVALIEGRTTHDGRKRAPQHLFGFNHRKPFPFIRVGLALTILGLVAKKYYDNLYNLTPKQKFMKKIVVSPYGVLGTQMSMSGSMLRSAEEPDMNTVVVDPAGLRYIMTTAAGAGGAAGAIYNWLGLKGAFPEDVVVGVSKVCDAKFHEYAPDKRVIHVVGPDFREGQWSEREAAIELSRAYRNVLHEFVVSDGDVLRVPPISSGVFSGSLYAQMPALTHWALIMAFEQLHTFDRNILVSDEKKFELCIFMNREWDLFKNAFDSLPVDSNKF